MKKILTALAIGVASVILVAPAAQADTPGCVSRWEYRHVHDGMSKSRVQRIFDTAGHLAVPGSPEIRSYRTCGRIGAVAVSYRHNKMTAKSPFISVH